jgi:hypothetical protein
LEEDDASIFQTNKQRRDFIEIIAIISVLVVELSYQANSLIRKGISMTPLIEFQVPGESKESKSTSKGLLLLSFLMGFLIGGK